MLLFIRFYNKTYFIDINKQEYSSIDELKPVIENKINIPSHIFSIFNNNKNINDITEYDTICIYIKNF